jgi:REP element-mobilizing transposase RayT
MSNTLLSKYRYRRRLPHLQKADCDLFVTFCTARRILPPAARDIVLEHCLREGGILPFEDAREDFAGEGARATRGRATRGRATRARATRSPRIQLHAVVIMPDHVHLLIRPLRHGDDWPIPLVEILQCLKGATAHRINKRLHTSGPVWEDESFDHVLRSDESLKEKAEYIRENPVRRGLVRRTEDYRWLWVDGRLA